MLLSLISVLVLLVIGFFGLWICATGRINANEGQELSIPGRAIVLAVGLVAFGLAYVVYSQPRADESDPYTATAPAMPSNPPDSRGGEAGTAEKNSPVAAAKADSPEPTASEAEPAVKAEAVAERPVAPVTAAVAPAGPGSSTSETEDSSRGLSAGAALLEAQARSRPRSTAVQPQIERLTAPAAESVIVASDEPTVAARNNASKPRRSSSSSARYNSNRRAMSTQPLLLHVRNTLGSNQLREQLTLSIEGKPVADIEVSDSNPSVLVSVPLPRPGLLHYRLEGVSEQDGTLRLVGEGCIRVRDGAQFAIRRKVGSRKVFLETAG